VCLIYQFAGCKGNESKAKKINNNTDKTNDKKKRFVRMAGGQKWEDETLNDWDPGRVQ
jgi:hypothetical protein